LLHISIWFFALGFQGGKFDAEAPFKATRTKERVYLLVIQIRERCLIGGVPNAMVSFRTDQPSYQETAAKSETTAPGYGELSLWLPVDWPIRAAEMQPKPNSASASTATAAHNSPKRIRIARRTEGSIFIRPL
jgi:hypothetical protein